MIGIEGHEPGGRGDQFLDLFYDGLVDRAALDQMDARMADAASLRGELDVDADDHGAGRRFDEVEQARKEDDRSAFGHTRLDDERRRVRENELLVNEKVDGELLDAEPQELVFEPRIRRVVPEVVERVEDDATKDFFADDSGK